VSSDNALLCHSPNVQVILNVQSQFQLLTSLYNHSFLFPQILSVLSTKDFGEIFGELCVCVCVCVCFFSLYVILTIFAEFFGKKFQFLDFMSLQSTGYLFIYLFIILIFFYGREIFSLRDPKKRSCNFYKGLLLLLLF